MINYYYKKKIKVPLYTGYLVMVFTNHSERLPIDIQDETEDFYSCSSWNSEAGIPASKVNFNIFLNFWYFDKITHNEIAHEISHTVDNIMKYHNIKRAKINEPSAYMSGWIANEIYEFAEKCGLKIKTK